MIDQLINNWLCWVIVLLALFCYQQLCLEYLANPAQSCSEEVSQNTTLQVNKNEQREFTAILISALPLLGLLGTIIGLLDCFAGIASEGASAELVSSGIGDALLTTQLGLVCAIPGWLLHSWIHSLSNKPLKRNNPKLAV